MINDARQSLEKAIINLRYLLDSGIEDENSYQKLFEDHPVIMESLGYTDAFPLRDLPLEGKEKYVPDFLCPTSRGHWEIVDLKRPSANIIKDLKRRNTFYADMNSNISQVRDYSEYFDDKANRDKIHELHGMDIHKRPKSVLIAGRDQGLDKVELHKLSQRNGGDVSILTYDDILQGLSIERDRHYRSEENQDGFSFHFNLWVRNRGPGIHYIIDAGKNPYRDRISIYLQDSTNLRFRVLDSKGLPHYISITPEKHEIDLGAMNYISTEMTIIDGFLHLSFMANGLVWSDCKVENVTFNRDGIFNKGTKKLNVIIGADLFARKGICGQIQALKIYEKTLSFWDRYGLLMHYLFDDIKETTLNLTEEAYVVVGQHPKVISEAYSGAFDCKYD